MLKISMDHKFGDHSRFKVQTSYMQFSYQTHWAIRPNKLGGFRVPKLATLRQEKSQNKESTCRVFEKKEDSSCDCDSKFKYLNLKKCY